MSAAHRDVRIRMLAPDEVAAHRELRLRALRDAPDSFGETFAEAVARPMSYWDGLTRSVTEPGHHVMFLVCEGETVHGCAYGLIDGERPGWGRVGGMWVAPACRRQGSGRALLQAVMTWARARGFEGLGLWVPAHSAAAMALYRPAGFRETGARRALAWNAAVDIVEMECALEGPGAGRVTETFRLTVADGRTTEELVAAGDYGYAHSCVTSENFPARRDGTARACEIALLEFDHDVTSEEVMREAARLGLERPSYEDALHFGIAHPDVQRERPVVFLHEPWVGFFGRRDVVCLWTNAGRRELGLDDFDGQWSRGTRFGFVRSGSRA